MERGFLGGPSYMAETPTASFNWCISRLRITIPPPPSLYNLKLSKATNHRRALRNLSDIFRPISFFYSTIF